MISGLPDTGDRRNMLRRLDDVLEALEQLNLQERPTLPEPLRRSLERHGIICEEEPEIRLLIEQVWHKQEPFLLGSSVDRRRNQSRRVGSRRPPGHQVVEGILRQLADHSSA